MATEQVELLVSHEPTPAELAPNELLLGDAMKGDAFRFARADYVDEAWRIVDPVLQSDGPVYQYDPHTWGPAEADRIVDCQGWHNPIANGGRH
jgi:glucose-6-phosphate 1-dehydrogenase